MKYEIVFMNQIKQNGWNKFIYMNFDNLDQIEVLNWIDHNGSIQKFINEINGAYHHMDNVHGICYMDDNNSFMNENHNNWTNWQMDEEKYYYHIDEIDQMRKFDNMDENECFP
jgi:hypothetical protein